MRNQPNEPPENPGRFNPKLGRLTAVIPNNKSNFLVVRSEDEAWFVAGFLNSVPAQSSISRFVTTTTIAPSALQRLPIPRFDPSKPTHAAMVQIAREVGSGIADSDSLTAAALAVL